MKSARDDLMLRFLVGKSYYFNSHRICPLWQPHRLRTEATFPFFTVCLACRCIISPRTLGMANPVFVCTSARQWNVTHLFKYCWENPLMQILCRTNHTQGRVRWLLVVCHPADDKSRQKQLAAGSMCESHFTVAAHLWANTWATNKSHKHKTNDGRTRRQSHVTSSAPWGEQVTL